MPAHGFINEREFLISILDTMSDGLMVVDREGTIISFNRAAERMTGYSSDEMIGRNCSILDTDTCIFHVGSGKKTSCSLFRDGKVSNRSCRIRSKDGSAVHLLKNAVVLRDENGKIIGGVETMTDISSIVERDLQIEELKQDINKGYGFMGILGTSTLMQDVFEQIRNAAASEAPVIITGESGTGKELAASAIHRLSRRKNGPFIKVNCAALNEFLLESELFGHTKGSFTGAYRDRQGRFQAASRGTIFLDEIGDMPTSMQVKLLRVLEEKEVERVGDNRPVPVDIRLITATNKDPYEMVESGEFREDLLYRVNVIPLYMPPLRERMEDLAVHISQYLKRISYVNNKRIKSVSPKAMEILKGYDWPGNIRQLINTLEYSAITCKSDTIDVQDLPGYVLHGRVVDSDRQKKHLSKRDVLSALSRAHGSRSLAARYLGISRVTLWKKLKKLEIEANANG